MDRFFFKIHIADLFQSTFIQAWLNPATLSRDFRIFLFQSPVGMPGMPDNTQEKLHDQTIASMDALLHAKIKLSTSNSFWDTKI